MKKTVRPVSSGSRVRPPSGVRTWRAARLLLSSLAAAAGLRAAVVPPTDNTSPPYLGTYGWGLNDSGLPQVERTANWLYRSNIWAHDGGGYGSWTAIEGEVGKLNAAREWLDQNPGGMYVYMLGMLPGNKATPLAGHSLANGAGSLSVIGDGAYNVHFAAFAAKLVSKGLANNTILRVGWEFNGNWFPWKVLNATDAARYAEYYREIVTAMRAVPGAENLKFDWNGAIFYSPYPIGSAYPGDDYVDYIGCDAYDECYANNAQGLPIYGSPYPDLPAQQLQQHRADAWYYLSITGNNNGLGTWRNFAASRGKPMSIPEWGTSDRARGGKDNPYFIQKMYEFIHNPANNVGYHMYFDVQAPDGHHQLIQLPNGSPSQFPLAAARYKKLFGLTPFPINASVGTVGLAGSASVDTFTGAGAGFLNGTTSDGFNFSHRAVSGDDELLVKIAELPASATAQAGLMLRQSLAANAAYAAVFVADGKCVFQSRTTGGARALQTSVVNAVAAPVWLKLSRRGDLVAAYVSDDGLNWLAVGDRTVSMTGPALLGLAVGSGNTSALASVTVTEVDYVDIQTNDTAAIAAAQVVDNADATGVTLTGAWNVGTTTPASLYYGANFLGDGNAGKGTKSVRFAPALAAAGVYDVYASWPTDYRRNTNIPINVTHANGTASFLANQQIGRHLWNHFGAFEFNAGTAGHVLLGTAGTTWHVAADAVMFVRRPVPAPVWAVADAFVRDGTYAGVNYATGDLMVKKDAVSYSRESFLRFNVAGLADAAVVQLQLTPVGINTATVATFTLEFVANDSWTETGLTWNNKPAGSGEVLGQLQISGLQVGVPVALDITDRVRAEAAGDGMLSIRIRPETYGSLTNVSFGSREHATSANRPRLLVQ